MALDRFMAACGDPAATIVVIGSVALGDARAGASDVDVVVIGGEPAPVPVPGIDAVYLELGDLARPPGRLGARVHQRDGRTWSGDEMVTPVSWHSVAEHGRVVRGSPVDDVWLDVDALRAWCRGNLASYWAGWAARGAVAASRDGMLMLTDWAVVWCVLGVVRLAYTISTGCVTSKSGAGRWALSVGLAGSGDRELVAEALALRTADGPGVAQPLPPADREAAGARRERVLAFMRTVIAGE